MQLALSKLLTSVQFTSVIRLFAPFYKYASQFLVLYRLNCSHCFKDRLILIYQKNKIFLTDASSTIRCQLKSFVTVAHVGPVGIQAAMTTRFICTLIHIWNNRSWKLTTLVHDIQVFLFLL